MAAATEDRFIGPLLVVELGSRIASGAAGSLLAQLGAQVVVVEPRVLASTSKWRYRATMMAGKSSVTLDWAHPSDHAKINELVEKADVVLLSTDIDPLQAYIWTDHCRSSPIICDITSFGHSGPLAGEAMSEGLVEALAGIVDTTGQPDGAPSPIGTPILEMHAALYAASAVIAARRVQRNVGLAQKIDVALFDIGATSLINFLPFVMAGKNPSRFGNRHALYAPWNLFEATDGSLLICAVTDQQWRSICGVIEKPELADDPRFATATARLENRGELDATVSSWTKKRSVAGCEQLLLENGIACGPVLRLADIQSDINVRHRQSVLNGKGRLSLSASPMRGFPMSACSPTESPQPNADATAIDKLLSRKRHRQSAASQPTTTQLPYEAIRIIEIGQYTVAPMAARIMGALGADVIKVESPLGDATRSGGLFREDGASYIFALSNTDKRGIVLDLRKEPDCELLHRLLKTADVLIENLKPGSLAKLGFSSEVLRKRYPNLIYCSISGFGTDSAYPGRPALDTVIQAMSGLMDITRQNGTPIKAGFSASDNLGGQFALLAICAAIELRDRTGMSNHFDLSMQDATLWATQLEWNSSIDRQHRPTIVRAADGYVAIECESAPDFGELEPSLSIDNSKLLTRDEMVSGFSQKIKAAPVLAVAEVLRHPQFVARELLVSCQTVEGDTWSVFSLPFKLLGTPGVVRRVMGRLGENDEQLRNELYDCLAEAAVDTHLTSASEKY